MYDQTQQLFATARVIPATSGGLAPWQLRRVTDYIESHFPERIELATLAAQIHLSQAHFSRAFKASTGVAPYQWQLNSRLRRAQGLLADTDVALGEIAQMTGFADPVHFGKTFRKHVGAPPGAWRSKHKR